MEVLINTKRYGYDDIRHILLQTVDLKKTFAFLEMRYYVWQHLMEYSFHGYQPYSVSMSSYICYTL